MTTKIGIIGAGGMTRYHVAGFRTAGAEVVQIADRLGGSLYKLIRSDIKEFGKTDIPF